MLTPDEQATWIVIVGFALVVLGLVLAGAGVIG
jgi:hypothetical protein